MVVRARGGAVGPGLRLLDGAAFDAMKPGAHVVNVARGSVVDRFEFQARRSKGIAYLCTDEAYYLNGQSFHVEKGELSNYYFGETMRQILAEVTEKIADQDDPYERLHRFVAQQRAVLAVAGVGAAFVAGPWGTVASLSPEVFLTRAGRTVRVSAVLRKPTPFGNPGLPDETRALARRGSRRS